MEIAIYGAGGFGREVKWLSENIHDSLDESSLVCFVDDNPAVQGTTVQGVPVYGLEEARQRYPAAQMVVAVGYTRLRAQMVEKATAAGWAFARLIHATVQFGENVQIGAGSIVTAGCILTTDIVIGQHVILNLDCTVGHDCVIGDFCTFAPGCHLAGGVHIERFCFFGQGASTMQGTIEEPLVVGENSTVGLNAIVPHSLPARSRVTLPEMVIRSKD
jgi:sugar O-acyltransferase (sialic acid O-acetyltransferase NeuD family)